MNWKTIHLFLEKKGNEECRYYGNSQEPTDTFLKKQGM